MRGLFKKSILLTAILLVLCCGIYPLAVWVVGQVVFYGKANGSLIVRDGQIIGSRLVAQNFERPEYFHPRPSAAGDKGYDATQSSGSNLALTNKKFVDGLNSNIKQVLAENPGLAMGQVPNDMVMASGSGLDPDITPENARVQVARVAAARHVDVNDVTKLLEKYIRGPDLGLLGESRVNVLELNVTLDKTMPLKK